MRGLERGIEEGFDQLGWQRPRVAAYVEIEAFVIENLVRQMEQGVLAPTPVFTNVKTFPASEFRGKIHGITGGYPCQPFSNAGLRKGEEDPRHLWPFIKRIVKKSRPDWVEFENVEGHLSLGFERVQKDLRQMGYVVEVGIFTAQEVGAPHRRARLFILGVENSFLIRMRRWHDEQRENRKCKVQVERSSELESSNSPTEWCKHREFGGEIRPSIIRQGNWEECAIRTASTSELVNTTGERCEESRLGGIGELPTQSGQRMDDRFEQSGGSMGNTDNSRLQGRDSEEYRECTYKWIAWPNDSFGQWPSRPGEEQYSWEEPRIESRVGYVVNGYNYREDLLRMAGNGVVSQCAAKATFELWNKILG